jgi:hypothetical protein
MAKLDKIFIEATYKTPEIDFDEHTGELILKGRCIPENTAKLFEPLLEWIGEYIKEPHTVTSFHLMLEYFNSSSLLWIIKVIKLLSKINKKGSQLFINLYFDNEDFDSDNRDVFKDLMHSIFDNIRDTKVTIGIKIIGTDNAGKIVDVETIFI